MWDKICCTKALAKARLDGSSPMFVYTRGMKRLDIFASSNVKERVRCYYMFSRLLPVRADVHSRIHEKIGGRRVEG